VVREVDREPPGASQAAFGDRTRVIAVTVHRIIMPGRQHRVLKFVSVLV
jgi:hypothetical protein